MKPRHFSFLSWTCILVAGLLLISGPAYGQGVVKWLIRGSLQNWFSEKAGEIEEGNVLVQQYGLQWPAQYLWQDNQAAKGFWIGCKNFTDQNGNFSTVKVVHLGPRVKGDGEFYPMTFDLYAKFDPPQVFVDGAPSFKQPEELSGVDPTLKADRLMVTTANTAIGLSITRKIYQFSQQYHDNYHLFEYTFKNTGYYDQTNRFAVVDTLREVYFFWQFRYSVNREGGNCVANSARWGINAMNDARGPWGSLYADSPTDLKAQFAWHGLHPTGNKPPAGYPGAVGYTNLGIPVWNPTSSETSSGVGNIINRADSLWRLAGSAFVGNVSIHAPKSPSDTSDDPTQPSTTTYVGSDDPKNFSNSQFNLGQNTLEYQLMSAGHTTRHALIVEPSGNFSAPTGDPSLGNSGGWSSGNGYGPYKLAPGDSITIIWAEGADGLTREENIRIGKQFRDGLLGAGAANDRAKNDSVFKGRDRLFNTFRRAIANYASGYNIPQPPYPPSSFSATGGGNKINLSWTASDESANGFRGYRLYRAQGKVDSTFYPIFECGTGTPNALTYSYDDVTAIRGQSYYYYITAFGDPAANTGVGLTPAGSLESSRFYTQTYAATSLKRPAPVDSLIHDRFRIVPNPYSINSNATLRWDVSDRIGFLNTPGNCKIKIFTELGELVKEIEHNDGSGDLYWNSVTNSNQVIVSGVYIVVVENRDTGDKFIRKLVVIR